MSHNDRFFDLKKGWIPNMITLIGLILMIPLFIFLNWQGYLISSLIVYVIGWIMDGLDGKIARKYHMESKFGAFFDQLADKLNTWSHIVYFWFVLSTIIADSENTLTFFAVVGVLIVVLGLSLIIGRIYMLLNENKFIKKISISAVPSGKIKTNVERSAICLLILNQIYIAHNKMDDISLFTIYLAIGALFVSIIFAFLSLNEQLSKIKCRKK